MPQPYIKSKSLWKGAFLVTGAAFLGKVLSALYRVPYQNITGDVGYYVYQQIYPFYGAAMVVAMYGFPVIISKLVMETNEKEGAKKAEEMAYASFLILLFTHIPIFLSLFFGADAIAAAMGDKRLDVPLRIISAVCLFIPVFSAFRGYFQGMGEMKPTAVSHVVEQCIRVAVILGLAFFVVLLGKGAYASGVAAAVGSIAGSAAGAVCLIKFYFSLHYQRYNHVNWPNVIEKIKQVNTKVLSKGLLVCMGAMIFILYQFIDAFSVARILQIYGMSSEEAKAGKGIFDRGQPLLQFGTVIATSFAMAVVPLISSEKLKGNVKASQQYAAFAVQVSFLIGAAAALGLFIIAEPVNVMLFENAKGTDILQILAVSLVFSGLIMAASAVLQGYDYFVIPAFFLVLGLFIKAGGNVWLIPLFNEKGAAAATVMGMAVTALCNIFFIYKKQLMMFPNWRWMLKAIVSLGTMSLTAVVLYITCSYVFSITTRPGAAAVSLLIALASALLYIWLLVRLSLFTREERFLLPGMEKIEKVIDRKEKKHEQ
ncbi:polysaccharide biosynthesis protein [Alteribacillus sp. YIM 98480]|uniref:putative polysaccharide biosynthesis protein n=1 Tax=Alteribacillus sp. YIM 98480 TaxID=2606599 RepID=UPI00131D39AC|nr:polysaccharide biosynthesis protein [Alteribacillus sp. YIM 98480]